MKLIASGKVKNLYEYNDQQILIEHTNKATAFNGLKLQNVDTKGDLTNEISSIIFEYLNNLGIDTHFIKQYTANSQICKKATVIPIEFICRNLVAGGLSKKLDIAEGLKLDTPILEICYKRDDLDDPMINDYHAVALKLITADQLTYIYEQILLINEYLKALFLKTNLQLVDFKLEFGFDQDGAIMLVDEFSPDNCRLWEVDTNEKFDKDRFRQDLGDLTPYYAEVLKRLRGAVHEID